MTDSSSSAYLLTWNQGKVVVTVPLDAKLNLPIMYGKASYDGFRAFAGGFSTFSVMLPDSDMLPMPDDMAIDMAVSKRPVTLYSPARDNHSKHVHFAHDVPTQRGTGKSYPKERVPTSQPRTTTAPAGSPSPSDDELFLSWHIKLGHPLSKMFAGRPLKVSCPGVLLSAPTSFVQPVSTASRNVAHGVTRVQPTLNLSRKLPVWANLSLATNLFPKLLASLVKLAVGSPSVATTLLRFLWITILA